MARTARHRDPSDRSRLGLFVGLATLDLGYLVAGYPEEDTKCTAEDVFIAAGGPAANAAVAFSFLAGGNARLLTGLGRHALAEQVRQDLERQDVEIADVIPEHDSPPPLSCITVSRRNGSRTVVSLDASRLPRLVAPRLPHLLDGAAIVLTDGHFTELSLTVARAAVERGIPVVLDGGRWRPGTDELSSYVDIAICSRSFTPPGAEGPEAVHDMLSARGMSALATTNGADPIVFSTARCRGEIPVPVVTAVDTLGAGDILHGAFCYYFINGRSFVDALREAAMIASASCRYFGTRAWMNAQLAPCASRYPK